MRPDGLTTDRLSLRQWREEDYVPFADMNADPRVMEYFPSVLTRAQSDALADRIRKRIAQQGWGFWALETLEGGQFIGFTGLNVPSDELPFAPCVEVGWRLAYEHWGRGYATEAARVSLTYGFDRLGLDEIVSFTALQNTRSRAVMERLGMRPAEEDFEHPAIPEGNPLRVHCLYRTSQEQWRQGYMS